MATNTSTSTRTKASKPWAPNEKQRAFLDALRSAGKPITLAEASEIAGLDFKPGTITPLVNKNIVASEDVSFDCLIVRADDTEKVVGKTKKTVKAYSELPKVAD